MADGTAKTLRDKVVDEREDLDDPATKRELIRLTRELSKWRKKVITKEEAKKIVNRGIEVHEEDCEVSTLYDVKKKGKTLGKFNKALNERPDLRLIAEGAAFGAILAVGRLIGLI